MREGTIDYMWHSTFTENPIYIKELQNFTRRHPGNPQNTGHRIDNIDRSINSITVSMDVFSTNLEWLSIPSFRHPEVVNWMNTVMKSNGIYNYRWGDAPLRTILAAKSFNTTAAARFCNFSYSHSSSKPTRHVVIHQQEYMP